MIEIKGLVSVVIPVHNRPKLLEEAVESIWRQTYPSIEVFIVDDASTDSTPQKAAALVNRWPGRMHLLQQDHCQGPGAARQIGLEAARGEFIQFLDSDDLLLPAKLERQVACLYQHPECQACYGISYEQDLFGGSPLVRPKPLKGTGQSHTHLFPRLLNERWWSTHTPLYRHHALLKIGPWNPWINEEDWEYEARLGATGARLVWLPECVSVTRRNPSEDHLSSHGSSDPRKLAHRALAQQSIFRCAIQAGVKRDAPEMKRFSRSAFLLSRQCAEAGLDGEASDLQRIAVAACVDGCVPADLRIYGWIGNQLGWNRAAMLSQMLRSFLPRRPGIGSWSHG